MRKYINKIGIISTATAICTPLLGFENTKTLPMGIRNLSIKSARTTISGKTNTNGKEELLAKPLEKSLTFGSIIKGENGIKKTLLRGFLAAEGFADDEAVLQINAEMKATIAVTAPIFSYGLRDNLTLALAIPYYSAATALETGFIPSTRAYELIRRLDAPEHNLTSSAKEVTDKLNSMDAELDRKLEKNGYRPLGNWSGRGLGDIILAAKYRPISEEIFKLANISGISLATGKIADPDILTSIPFGKGAHQLFTGLIIDERLPFNFMLNQFGKYTQPLPARHQLRLKTAEEAIEVEKESVKFQLGPQFDGGASLQFEPSWGMTAGLGYLFTVKNKDRYYLTQHPDSKEKWEENTYSRAHFLESKFGYSGVEAFKRHEIIMPFTAELEYKKFLSGINSLTNDVVSANFAVFF